MACRLYLPWVCCLLCGLVVATPAWAQTTLYGQVVDADGRAVEAADIVLARQEGSRLHTLNKEVVLSDREGRFQLLLEQPTIARLIVRHPDYLTLDEQLDFRRYQPQPGEGIVLLPSSALVSDSLSAYEQDSVSSNMSPPAEVHLQIQVQPRLYQLSTISVNSERDRDYELLRLRAVEGTAIYAGRKTEVVDLSRLNLNRATNNPRQLYSSVAGLNIYESDDAGLQLSVGGRGLDPNRTASFTVRQNGYDISADALGYPESYYSPPAEAIDRIEVVRGAASLQYGSQFGGLLRFVLPSPEPDRVLSGRLRQTVGSYGLSNTFLSMSGTLGKLGYYAHGQYKSGNGFRPNSEYRNSHAYLRLDYSMGQRSRLIAELTWLDYLAQQPGGLTDRQFAQDPTQSNRSRNWFEVDWLLLGLRYESRLGRSTDVSVQLTALDAARRALGFRSNRVSQIDDPLSPRDLLIGQFNNLSLESRLLHRYQLGRQAAVLLLGAKLYRADNDSRQGPGSASAEADFDLADSQFPAYPAQSDFRFPNANVALFAEHIFYLSERTSLTPGLRMEWIDTESEGRFRRIDFDLAGNPIRDEWLNDNRRLNRSFLLAGLGMSHRPDPQLELYANTSQNYRSVTFSDIRVVNPSFQVDPDIQDERGYTLDLGLRGRRGRWAFDGNVYVLRYDQRLGEVLRAETRLNAEGVPVETGRIVRFRGNIGDAVIYGFESLNRYAIVPHRDSSRFRMGVFVNLALTQSRYLSSEIAGVEGRQVEFVPTVNLRTGMNLSWHRLSAALQYSFLSSQFTDATNAARNPNDNLSGIVGSIPAYGVMDLSLEYRLGVFKLEAGINNLLDNSYFTRRATGYPGPGIIPALPRTFYVGLEWNFQLSGV